jgi:uncharacterized protein YggE
MENTMRQNWIFVLMLLLPCLTAVGEDTPRRSISTAGEATVYVVPDQAEIALAVVRYSAKLDDAKSADDKGAASAVQAIEAVGVDPKQISTNDVTVTINSDGSYENRRIVGYTIRRAYVVKLTGITLVSKVIDAALNNGANELSGVTFNSTELRKYRDQARRMAAKAAKEKAVDLATVLDAAIGPVRTVNESSGIWGNYWGGYYGRGGYGGSNMTQNAVAQGGGDDGTGGGDTATPPGQIAIRASVSTTFDLQDVPPQK